METSQSVLRFIRCQDSMIYGDLVTAFLQLATGIRLVVRIPERPITALPVSVGAAAT